jgi:maltose alpha-D-glucosyltransferase/alpha-amylase
LGRQTLEREVLPAFIRQQRWFGGKARRLSAVRVVDWGRLPGEGSIAFFTLCRTDFADGTSDLYCLPLGVTAGLAGEQLVGTSRSWVVARLHGRGGEAVLHDALADDATCTALLSAIGTGREFPTRAGRIHAFPTAAYPRLRGDAATPLTVVRGPATSSNSLVYYGERLLLKLFRRLEMGVNPDYEVGRFLTEESPFDRIPQVAGALEYHRPGSDPITLAMLQTRVANRGDGWSHALGELEQYFERIAAGGSAPPAFGPDPRTLLDLAEADPPPAAQESMGTYLQAAATLGRRTAQLHLALGRDTGNSAFAPEPLTATDLADLQNAITQQVQVALTFLEDNLDRLPQAVGPAARRLLEEGVAVRAKLAHLAHPGVRAAKIRCHGDYHLGQVLWADHDFIVLDFEGEPTRTVEERRAKQSPLKDVAGMARSFHYAAYAGLIDFTRRRPADFDQLEPWAQLWYQWVAAAFLRTYRTTASRAAFLPSERRHFAGLLDVFMLDKAFYELLYELNNRPDWVPIPLSGILALIRQAP